MAPSKSQRRPESKPFTGFESLQASHVYLFNQFFDVCLPNYSRGTVRIVASVLRQTLGWLDKEGNPIRQDVTVTYRDLTQKAGVSRGAITQALQDAVAGNFLICTQRANESAAGKSSQTAAYRLRWDTEGDYTAAPARFRGFYRRQGNRASVPNSYFDMIIPTQLPSVVKVGGAVIRHAIGDQNQLGGRRTVAPLSYSRLQHCTKVADRSTLSAAIRHSKDSGYICCDDPGEFPPGSRQQKAATFSIR